ncbi:hypothetical protein RIF29_45500 [Crotalaria pallida]|uniref:Uncharacterized protein n=1 Tax=Crotalaria pallida TaxID=3830 RepID=A0AAN9DW61_CROPI
MSLVPILPTHPLERVEHNSSRVRPKGARAQTRTIILVRPYEELRLASWSGLHCLTLLLLRDKGWCSNRHSPFEFLSLSLVESGNESRKGKTS